MTPIERFWKGVEYNDCERLGIAISRTSSQPYARCVVIHLLTRDENKGNHNLYFDVVDERNKQIKGATIRGLNGNINLTAKIDKPTNEFGTNFSLFAQDTVTCWVDELPGIGRIPSDKVAGFSTRWGGPIVGGQDYGHISYYVIWQVKMGEPATPPVMDCDKLQESYLRLQADYKVLQDKLNQIKQLVS